EPGRAGPLHAQESKRRGGVHDLHIVGDDEAFKAGSYRGVENWFAIEEELVRKTMNVEVAQHFRLGVHKGGVAALSRAERLDVLGHLAVEHFFSVAAQEN